MSGIEWLNRLDVMTVAEETRVCFWVWNLNPWSLFCMVVLCLKRWVNVVSYDMLTRQQRAKLC